MPHILHTDSALGNTNIQFLLYFGSFDRVDQQHPSSSVTTMNRRLAKGQQVQQFASKTTSTMAPTEAFQISGPY